MKKIIRTILLITLSLFSVATFAHGDHDHPTPSAHLTFKKGSIHIHANFIKNPVAGEEAFLKMETRDGKTHSLIDISDDLDVELWMTEMNHGSSPSQVERVVDANGNPVTGTFLVRSLYFTMGGKWDVRVKLTSPEGASEQKSFSVQINGSGHSH
nr:serine protease spb1 [Bacteriovorax sp. HI3]